LYNSVQAVAQRFTAGALRDRYVAAAKDFRAPYFDWAGQPASGSSAFPAAIASPNISVVDVDGRTKTIVNPINRFVFHPVNPSRGDFNSNVGFRLLDTRGTSTDSPLVVPFPHDGPLP
jgi:tyrosinase